MILKKLLATVHYICQNIFHLKCLQHFIKHKIDFKHLLSLRLVFANAYCIVDFRVENVTNEVRVAFCSVKFFIHQNLYMNGVDSTALCPLYKSIINFVFSRQ